MKTITFGQEKKIHAKLMSSSFFRTSPSARSSLGGGRESMGSNSSDDSSVDAAALAGPVWLEDSSALKKVSGKRRRRVQIGRVLRCVVKYVERREGSQMWWMGTPLRGPWKLLCSGYWNNLDKEARAGPGDGEAPDGAEIVNPVSSMMR